MKPDLTSIDQKTTVSPHAQEVECALILAQMINTVKDDPAQMRLAIYEFARARLLSDMSLADGLERKRLSEALEAAIESVEDFSVRQEDRERFPAPNSSWKNRLEQSSLGPSVAARPVVRQLKPIPNSVPFSEQAYLPGELPPLLKAQKRRRSTWVGLRLGALIVGVAAAAILAWRELGSLSSNFHPLSQMQATTGGAASQKAEVVPQTPSVAPEVKTASVSPDAPRFAIPTDYGVYALADGALSELHLLTDQVPDKRVAVSTPINQPSQTTLPNGAAKFVLFRRDLAGNAPDRMEVRVVARVARALTFDPKGKPSFSPVSNAWNIRNLSYEFRVRPVAGNPEMLFVQAENPGFSLPAGRYVLVLKGQGYDFTVPGDIVDPGQCLERTDAANGAFYSDCQKR